MSHFPLLIIHLLFNFFSAFAHELLDDVYDGTISKAKSLCMVSDGWSNINRESVQNFIVCIPKPLFFDAVYSGEESHTAIWISNEII